MMKYKALQQKLVKTSAIAVAVVCALSAAAYGVYMWSDSIEQDFTKAEREARNLRNDLNLRENKAIEAEKYIGLYTEIQEGSESSKRSDLNRDKAQKWISEVASELQLTNLNGTFDPVVNIESPEFQKKTLQAITSKVTLTFAALSDEQLYRFVQAISKNFPGYVRITKVMIERKGVIDDTTLLNAGKGVFPELVEGSIEFQWIAVKKQVADPAQNGSVE